MRKIYSLVQQETINQRLKFLIETLSVSVRAFSEQIGESAGNTNNYIGSRQLAPKHEYLAKVLKHFSTVNAHWLITGEGEPFLSGTTPSTTITQTQKKVKGPDVGATNGPVTYNVEQYKKERDIYQAECDSLQKQIDLLRDQLTMKDQLLAAKDEMLALLRGGYNRPN